MVKSVEGDIVKISYPYLQYCDIKPKNVMTKANGEVAEMVKDNEFLPNYEIIVNDKTGYTVILEAAGMIIENFSYIKIKGSKTQNWKYLVIKGERKSSPEY